MAKASHLRDVQCVMNGRFFSAHHQEGVELGLMELVDNFQHAPTTITLCVAVTPSQRSHCLLGTGKEEKTVV